MRVLFSYQVANWIAEEVLARIFIIFSFFLDDCWLHWKPRNVGCCLQRLNCGQMIADGFWDWYYQQKSNIWSCVYKILHWPNWVETFYKHKSGLFIKQKPGWGNRVSLVRPVPPSGYAPVPLDHMLLCLSKTLNCKLAVVCELNIQTWLC